MGDFRSGIAEESRRRRGHLGTGELHRLAENMVARDNLKHEGETAPPIDRDLMVFGRQDNLSVEDTTFMSPEKHRELAWQAMKENRRRELDANNRGLIRDYPEDYLVGGLGAVGLTKNLATKTLKKLSRNTLAKNLKANRSQPLSTRRNMQNQARQREGRVNQVLDKAYGQLPKVPEVLFRQAQMRPQE